MPISYVAPGPVLSSANFARRGGQQLAPGAGGDAPLAARVVQLHDDTGQLQNRVNLQALQGVQASNLSAQEFGQRAQLQAQAAELDAWQFGQKVTVQEQAKLRQDQNAIAAIDADPTMTPKEKILAKTRIKTRIDWVGERQQRDLQQAQTQMAQQHSQAYKMQAELNESRIQFATQAINGKLRTIVDDDAVEELGEMVELLNPGLKERDPTAFGKLVEKAAIRAGRATRYASNADGSLDLRNSQRFGPGGTTSGAGNGTRGGARDSDGDGRPDTGGEREMGEKDYAAMVKDSLEMARKDKETDPSVDVAKRAAEYRKSMEDALSERRASRDPAAQKAAARKGGEEALAKIDMRMKELGERTDLGPVSKQFLVQSMTQAKKIMTKYQSTAEMPPEVYREYVRLTNEFKELPPDARAAQAKVFADRVGKITVSNMLGGREFTRSERSQIDNVVRQIKGNPELFKLESFNLEGMDPELVEEIKKRLKE